MPVYEAPGYLYFKKIKNSPNKNEKRILACATRRQSDTIKVMQTITVYTREDFRRWLAKYGTKERRVAVIVHKRHTGTPAPSHRELIEEAICYGWIDTTIKRLDEDRFVRNFSRRSEQSTWSENTLRYAKQLEAQGKMTEQGLRFYRLGKTKPVHDHGIPKNPTMPKELKTAFEKNKAAGKRFAQFPPSAKKMLYRWVLGAKRPETKERRVARIIANAHRGSKNIITNT